MSAQGYGVCYGFGEVESLSCAHGDEVTRERAQTFGRRLVAREEGKSAKRFYALFIQESTQFLLCGIEFCIK